ncbi:hypothetical protein [Candidatus Cyanaurora vandensis]|uniref:hypothetical protein n=1 Tax=Candidatus Cyanaurora vandensis TaxID=2714958 RepID=UPI00257DBCF3|nr:hypothetical protein [Candidatus Cyanaurora vandensis]
MNTKIYLYLGGACIMAIAAVGCVFELAFGNPKFGTIATVLIFLVSSPATVYLFGTAVKEGRMAQ